MANSVRLDELVGDVAAVGAGIPLLAALRELRLAAAIGVVLPDAVLIDLLHAGCWSVNGTCSA
jgi:hypothetical protein